MKVGLVLEGGAMRGMYTAGVLDIFMKHNLTFDAVVGVSAGALFGVNLLSGQEGRVIRYNKRFNADKNYMGIIPLLKEGNIVSTKYAYEKVPTRLDVFDDESFKQSLTSFYAVITNMATGEPEYVKINSVFEQMDVLRASGSMPFVSRPVIINNQKYLDGGVADSIPYEWMLSKGYDKLVVVLTRDAEYRKKPMSKSAASIFYRKYPNFKAKIINRYKLYNESIEKLLKLENEGKAFVIRPSKPIEINRIEKNPQKLQTVYDLGVSDYKCLEGDLYKYLDIN